MLFSIGSKQNSKKESVKKKIATFIPCGDLPKCPELVGKKTFWCGAEMEKKSSNSFGPKDIIYEHNSHGYRSPEFSVTADFKIISIGCSFVYGVGLPQHNLFHEIIAQRIAKSKNCSVVNWNLGLSARSNDYISRMLSLAVPLLKPDLVLVVFSAMTRREYIDDCGNSIHYGPWSSRITKRNTKARRCVDRMDYLVNDYDDIANTFRNYKSVENCLSGVKWFWGEGWRNDIEQHLHEFANEENHMGSFQKRDLARDNNHPGVISNLEMADRCWELVEASL